MAKNKIIQKLKEIIIESMELKCTPEEIKGDDLITELGINSVDALEILVWVENTFKILIDDDDLNSQILSSLDTLGCYIEKKLEA